METLQTIAAFVLTLGILVTVHEFGHYWVARRCGIKVLAFSIGFGPSILKWRSKSGTQFMLAVIPLGGYVKMLDEREGPVSHSELHQAFNRQPVTARMAVVVAGPIANFLLAVAALWLMFLVGIQSVLPVIGEVIPDSPAAMAGLKSDEVIVSVSKKPVDSWRDVSMVLLNYIAEDATLNVVTKPFYGELDNDIEVRKQERTLSINNWLVDTDKKDPIAALGVKPWYPKIPAIVHKVLADGVAERAGLMSGDKIISVNNTEINQWHDWVKVIQENPEKKLRVSVQRQNNTKTFELIPDRKIVKNGVAIGYAGVAALPIDWPPAMIKEIKKGPFDALQAGISGTLSLSVFTLDAISKMIQGLLSLDNLSGPITIAKVASASISSGLTSFLYFLAMVSVSLGVINLLPIPVLDGGHLFYYCAELLYGRPLPEKIQEYGVKIGMLIILSVMALALYNDFSRL